MKRARLRHHLPTAEEHTGDLPPTKEPATALNSGVATQLDVCRCPKCDCPMTARHGPTGPYFHCQCVERRRRAGAMPVVKKVQDERAAAPLMISPIEESVALPPVAYAPGSPIIAVRR